MIIIAAWWFAAWQVFEVACVVAWALVLILMLVPKRRVTLDRRWRDVPKPCTTRAEVGEYGMACSGVVQPRRSDASVGGLSGEPALPPFSRASQFAPQGYLRDRVPPDDEGFA